MIHYLPSFFFPPTYLLHLPSILTSDPLITDPAFSTSFFVIALLTHTLMLGRGGFISCSKTYFARVISTPWLMHSSTTSWRRCSSSSRERAGSSARSRAAMYACLTRMWRKGESGWLEISISFSSEECASDERRVFVRSRRS